MNIRAGIGLGSLNVVIAGDVVVMARASRSLAVAAADHAKFSWKSCRCKLCVSCRRVHREYVLTGWKPAKSDPANDL